MKRKRKAANPAKGANRKSKSSNTQIKVSDYRRINQTAAPRLERVYFNPGNGAAVITPDPANDPRMQHVYLEPMPRDWFAPLCELLDRYKIRVLYVEGTQVNHELRAYCERKGVEYVAN